jgi:phosphoenolpyruvate phosphomutase
MSSQPTRAKRFHDLIVRKEPTIIMEAHNGLTAKLVEEAGFEAIWASGLSLSAALGVRDNNEASWTQVLDVLEFMADASTLPILLDGDTGYGNFNNVRRLIKKLEQRNVAGVCLEDKLFPKTNSFINGEKQALAEIDEFCGKLQAAKDTQDDPHFVVIARTEAFIAGWGLEEALLRATAYADAGADCILVHSKRKDSQDIMAFMKAWDNRKPVVIVPTQYPTEPMAKFVEAGVGNFIFANQTLRTTITAVQQNLKKLFETRDLMSVEKSIAPVSEIFRLQNTKELEEAEDRYLPDTSDEGFRAVVLAATKGNFGKLVEDKPKAMLHVEGKPVLTWHREAFNRQGIKDMAVVRGYKKEAVNLAGLHYFDNDEFAATGELYSLYQARDYLKGNLLVAYGDILFDHFILQNLLGQKSDITIAADAGFRLRKRADKSPDLVQTSGVADPMKKEFCKLVKVGGGVDAAAASGEWVGLLALREAGTEAFVKALDELAAKDMASLRKLSLGEFLSQLTAKGTPVHVVHTFGHWRDLDEQADLSEADHVS